MRIDGFALIEINSGNIVQEWTTLPGKLRLPNGDIVYNPEVGYSNGWHRVAEHSFDVPDERRSIRKETILARITDQQLELAISMMSQRQKERWRMPGRATVYVDDPDTVAIIKAVGADPAVVLAPDEPGAGQS